MPRISIRTPRFATSLRESCSDWSEVKCEGMKNVVTLSAPSASTAIAVVSAESMPPDRPITAPRNPDLST